ncbi:MAG: cupin domain-containing protein [Pseudomonadota bacterium]
MGKSEGVIRLEAGGPAAIGLTPMTLDPADFQSPLPDQHIHLYYEAPEIGLSVGVWTTTDMQEAFGPYPGDEFMLLLEGRVVMVDGDGGETAIETGQTFVLRNGIPISWKQEGFLRKLFLLYQNPAEAPPRVETAAGGILVLDPTTPGADLTPVDDPIGGGQQRERVIFTNDAGSLTVGEWESSAFASQPQPYGVHEFVQLIEGAVTITELNGEEQQFQAGDVFFIPKGTHCGWRAEGPVRKYYVAVT